MLAKRIIPCLDVRAGRVVKGIHFKNLRDAGNPVDIASRYSEEGADELVFLDITATLEDRDTIYDVVRRTASQVFIPLTVGGGIRTTENINSLLRSGADKVSVNSAAVTNNTLVREASGIFGSQCIVTAIDAKRIAPGKWEVYVNSGTKPTGLDVVEWARRAEELGSGEILLTSIDCDGTRNGYDIELTAAVSGAVNIPVIASGGAGTLQHLHDVLKDGSADAVLAASIFHYNEHTIQQAKDFLKDRGIPVRT